MSWLPRLALVLFALATVLVNAVTSASAQEVIGETRVQPERLSRESLPYSHTLFNVNTVVSTNRPTKRVSLMWKSQIEAMNYEAETERQDLVQLNFAPYMLYAFSPKVTAEVAASLQLSAGSVQSIFEDNRPANGVVLDQGLINFAPTSYLNFKGGAVNQAFLRSPLLLGSKPFPGVIEQIKLIGDETNAIQLVAQQAIPTSETLGTRTTNVEKTPYLMTTSLAGKATAGRRFSLAGHATYFHFSDLPSEVARESRIYGNTVAVNGPLTNEFVYRFAGVATNLDVGVWLTEDFGVRLGMDYVENFRAPEDINKGQQVYASLRYKGFRGLSFEPKFGTFTTQSDVVPGYYADAVFGRNNRTGYLVELETRFTEIGLILRARYVESEVINVKPLQSDQNYFLITVGTDYAEI